MIRMTEGDGENSSQIKGKTDRKLDLGVTEIFSTQRIVYEGKGNMRV